MKFLVLGGGAQGSCAAYDLLQQPDVEEVVVADVSQAEPCPAIRDSLGERLRIVRADASKERDMRPLLRERPGVLCALPYHLNEKASQLAVEHGAHFCDLGGNTEIVESQRRLDAEAKRADVSVIPNCGLAPGLVNILAQGGIDVMDRVDSVRMLVGGLPQDPQPPLGYRVVYSLEGLLDYYTTPGEVLRDGRIAMAQALDGLESVDFGGEIGVLECFHTGGGASAMPARCQGKIDSLEYKTLRYPGHARIVLAMRDMGLFSKTPVACGDALVAPRDVFLRVAGPKLALGGDQDFVVLRVVVTGAGPKGPARKQYDLLDRYDEATGFTAMARTTGFSLSITALMQARDEIAFRGVAAADEVVPMRPYLRELEGRGISVRVS